jgi:hypothetical protein
MEGQNSRDGDAVGSGIIIASLSQSLQCLIVAPRLLQNMAKDLQKAQGGRLEGSSMTGSHWGRRRHGDFMELETGTILMFSINLYNVTISNI